MEGAIFSHENIDQYRMKELPKELTMIVLGLDPAIESKRGSKTDNEHGIIIAATDGTDFYVIEDLTCQMSDTLQLSEKIIRAYERHNVCLLYTSPSPRDATLSRMPSSA